MEQIVSATEARVHFGELMRRVIETDMPVVVERDGKPQVVVISKQMYDRMRKGQAAEDWWERVLQCRERIRRELKGRTLPAPEDIIRQMREERDEQLTGLH